MDSKQATDKNFGELWDKFDDVYNRLTMGRRDLKGFWEFCNNRHSVEERYAKDLDAAAKKAPPAAVANCSLSGCYTNTKEVGHHMARQHQMFAVSLKEIAAEADKMIKDIKVVKTKLLDTYQKLHKDADSKKAACLKAKAAYDESVQKADTSVMSLNSSKSSGSGQNEKTLRKLEDAAASAKKELDTKHATYLKSVRDCQQAQAKYYDESHSMLLQFEDLERKRLSSFEELIKKYEQAHEMLQSSIQQMCLLLSKSRSDIDIAKDIQTFIDEIYTGNLPEPPVDYLPKESSIVHHYGDSVAQQESKQFIQEQVMRAAERCRSATAAMNGTIPQYSTNAAAPSFLPPGGLQPPAAVAIAQPQGAKSGSPMAVALYEYRSTEQGDLNFPVDARIQLTSCNPADEWWEGTYNGASGAFPRDYVKRLDDGAAIPAPAAPVENPFGTMQAAPAVAVPAAANGRKYRALYDFKGEAADELSFTKGAILTVLRDVDEWFEGMDEKGNVGIFPTNYVQPL